MRHTTLEVVRAPPDTSSYVAGVDARKWQDQEVVRAYTELQSKQRAAYGDDETVREGESNTCPVEGRCPSPPYGPYA